MNESFFNPKRFPVALYLGNEDYPYTIRTEGDGKAAIVRYLGKGGTLVVLASGPFPYFYAIGPGGSRPVIPLLPQIGLPITGATETAPAGLKFVRQPGQEILRDLPESFPFGEGDGRLRTVRREQVDPAHHYLTLVKATDTTGADHGNVACWIKLKAGPASGGRILYVWSTLQAGPHGNAILADSLRWVLRGFNR